MSAAALNVREFEALAYKTLDPVYYDYIAGGSRDEITVRMAVTPDHVWPNKKEHSSFLTGSRHKKLQMSRWLADTQLFPKF